MKRYHYIVTIQWVESSGTERLATAYESAFFEDGVSEKDRFEKILEAACAKHGAPPKKSAVLFYRLAPDAADGA